MTISNKPAIPEALREALTRHMEQGLPWRMPDDAAGGPQWVKILQVNWQTLQIQAQPCDPPDK